MLHRKTKVHISEYNDSGSPKVHKEISHMENMPLDINVSISHPEMQIILLQWNFGIIRITAESN
jgi:hypothetical protein